MVNLVLVYLKLSHLSNAKNTKRVDNYIKKNVICNALQTLIKGVQFLSITFRFKIRIPKINQSNG